MEVECTKYGIFFGQKYVKCHLERYTMIDYRTISTYTLDMKPKNNKERKLKGVIKYHKMVGSLIYLTITQPNIAYSVGVVSRYMSNPKKPHINEVRNILRYTKGTINLGILYRKYYDTQ